MPLFLQNLQGIGLPNSEISALWRLADKQERMEHSWVYAFKKELLKYEDRVWKHITSTGRVGSSVIDLEPFFAEHYFDYVSEATKTAASPAGSDKRLARKTPRTIREVMRQYDEWRKKGKVPKKQAAYAEEVKEQYLKRIQKWWAKYGESYRDGEVTSEWMREKLRRVTDATYGRTQVIVRTEGTKYWNTARKDYYDSSEDVTHYLFLAIRDARTTPWCKSRHNVVFKKGTALFDKNVPPCHWNCRSEIVPLTPKTNPSHRTIVDDRKRRAENRSLVPLPKGWSKS